MAKHYRPGRSLLLFTLGLVGLLVWAFLPGENHSPKLGLDLRGGTQVILSPKVAAGQSLSQEQLNQTVAIIRQRVDGFGVAESEVTIQGSGDSAKIIVTIPGETSRTVVDQLKTTAQLNFRPVIAIDFGTPQPTASPTPTTSAAPSESPSAEATPTPTPTVSVAPELLLAPIQSLDAAGDFSDRFTALDCNNSDILNGATDDPAQYLITCEKDGSFKYVLAPADLVGTDIESATAGLPQQGAGGWQVELLMTTEGAKKFATSTQTLSAQQTPNDQFAIVLDGVVISAPSVNEPILGGSAVISGSFTADDARALAQVLKYGALPVSLEVDEVQQISPTLGADQLRAGLIAGGFGLLLVIIYLLLYYRALGVIAVISLFAAAAMTYFVIIILGRGIGFTLTLAGVAGAIVSIGITADSFVIYFERIRDEIREGKRLRVAVEQGWIRARRTILAADFVSLLAAAILFYLSVGSVRGFAFTLGLITFVDIAVAFVLTRSLVTRLASSKWMNKGSAMTGVSPARLGVISAKEEVN
ncbi:MAG: protein translocase subunit SecD [Actinomycetes bacterium]